MVIQDCTPWISIRWRLYTTFHNWIMWLNMIYCGFTRNGNSTINDNMTDESVVTNYSNDSVEFILSKIVIKGRDVVNRHNIIAIYEWTITNILDWLSKYSGSHKLTLFVLSRNSKETNDFGSSNHEHCDLQTYYILNFYLWNYLICMTYVCNVKRGWEIMCIVR
jgi:hypothetical protein